MLYKTELTIPANTSSLTPVTSPILLMPGKIVEVGIGFPPGCVALAHVVIKQKLHQLWPSSEEHDFHWDNIFRTFREDLTIDEEPYTLTVVGWNEDEIYEHTITVEINLLAGDDGWQTYLQKLIGVPIG